MFYNRKGIQKTIINERKEQERLDSLTLNEWMTPGLRRTINNAAAEARHDMTLSWEDMCNPRISTWTRNLKKANRDMSNVMFGNTQWEGTGKPDKTASEAMHMAWKPKDFPNAMIPKDIVKKAFQKGKANVIWGMQFLAGHCFKTAFAKVNEIKGKVTKDEEGKLDIDGKWSIGLSKLNSTWEAGEGILKFFTYGDKYILMQYGFQNFVLFMMKDARGRIVNKANQFERLAQEADNDAKAAIDKKYPPVQPRKFNK